MPQPTITQQEHKARDDAASNTLVAVITTYNFRGDVRLTQRDLQLLTSGKAFSTNLMDFALFSAYNCHVESLFRTPSPVCLFPSDAFVSFHTAKKASDCALPSNLQRPIDFRYIMMSIPVSTTGHNHWLLAVLVNIKALGILEDDPMGSNEEWDPARQPPVEPPPAILIFNSEDPASNVAWVVKVLAKMTERLVGVYDKHRMKAYIENCRVVKVC